ncbi:Holliday junction resolvase RuvX [Nevskia sp.]|uniref:Holliday junction resolvase RuvX n=1 Tax=Nevskia sp. TaxID=1929292 RepID=UPI0025DEE947|nr:Holliday junction resolvase RuvX [Nevskia sp.]
MPEAVSETPVETAKPATRRTSVYLAFDFGLKRIGMAVGDDLTKLARPLPAIANGREPDWTALNRGITDWRPAALIVGLPINLDGEDQPITAPARAFAVELGRRYRTPVYLVDERLTSRAADDEIRAARADGRKAKKVQKGDRDGVAARLILEQFLGGDRSRFFALPDPS